MLDTEISESENNIQDEFIVNDDPVMKSALDVITKIGKTNRITIKGKGKLCHNAVSICNIITENMLKGNTETQKITVDSEILDDGQMISTIELILRKTS